MPAGLNASDAPRWPCTAATHARVMPQNGHGMPVSARSGHASGGCTGSSGHTAAAPTEPAADDAQVARVRSSSGVAAHGVHDTPCVTCGPAWRRRCLRARTRDGCSAGCPATFGREPVREVDARSTSAPASAARGGGRGTGGSLASSSASTAETSHVATASGGTVIGAGDAARARGSGRASTIVPAGEVAEPLVVLRSRRSRSTPTSRRRAGSRRCARCCGSRSRGSGPARPSAPTTRMPAASLPIVRPLFSSLERHVVREHDEEDRARSTTPATPARRAGCATTPIASAMMIATWITVSRRRARNREPSPASTSSSATPSGVAIVTRSSRCTCPT